MIYKIQSNFDYDVLEVINKLKKDFNMIYYNNTLYVAIKQIDQEENCNKMIKKFFKPNKSFLFTKINENNLKNENNFIIEWCKNILVDLDTQRFEKDNQEKIKKYLYDIDLLENKLKEIAERKEEELNA